LKPLAASDSAADSVIVSSSRKRQYARFAFERSARLLDGNAYGRVFKRNIRVTSRYWIVLGHKTAPGSNELATAADARLGLAIAKKRAKRAVDRNRLKRIARESFRHQRSALSGIDVVVMNKDQASTASAVHLRRSLDALWGELINKADKR